MRSSIVASLLAGIVAGSGFGAEDSAPNATKPTTVRKVATTTAPVNSAAATPNAAADRNTSAPTNSAATANANAPNSSTARPTTSAPAKQLADPTPGSPAKVPGSAPGNQPLIAVEASQPETLSERIMLPTLAAEPTASAEKTKPSTSAGYKDGFFIEVKGQGEEEFDFLLKHNNRMQIRHTAFDSRNANGDENNLEIERVRPAWKGYLFRPYFEYELELDIGTDDEDLVQLYDAFVLYKFSEPLGWENEMGVQLGLWKMQMFRQEYTSDGKQQLVDRSMPNEFFNIDHSVAVSLFGNVKTTARPIWWHLILLNGFDTDGIPSNRKDGLDRNFGYVGRLYSDLVGEWGPDEEPDLVFHESPAVRAGVSVAFTRVHIEGDDEFEGFRVVDSGAKLATLVPALDEYSVWLYGLDVGYKYAGIALFTEYFFRQMVEFDGAPIPDLFDHGFYLQGGYFVIPDKFEVVARYGRVIGDSATLGAVNESADEAGGGFNWYFHGHQAKIQFDVFHYNGVPISSSSVNLKPGDDGVAVRTQFQVAY